MKLIIAGSRTMEFNDVVEALVENDLGKHNITEVVCGLAKGADIEGKVWAEQMGIPVKEFEAKWNVLDDTSYIKLTRYGKPYNALAGFNRNEEMAKYADAVLVVWDGKSTGTKDMINRAEKHNLEVFIWIKGQ